MGYFPPGWLFHAVYNICFSVKFLIPPGFKAGERVRSHSVRQIIEAPFEGHSKKPDETRRRIVELLGDVPRIDRKSVV